MFFQQANGHRFRPTLSRTQVLRFGAGTCCSYAARKRWMLRGICVWNILRRVLFEDAFHQRMGRPLDPAGSCWQVSSKNQLDNQLWRQSVSRNHSKQCSSNPEYRTFSLAVFFCWSTLQFSVSHLWLGWAPRYRFKAWTLFCKLSLSVIHKKVV